MLFNVDDIVILRHNDFELLLFFDPKALNLVEKGELSEPEEDVPAEIVLEESAEEASEETVEEAVVESDTETAEAEAAKEVKEAEEGSVNLSDAEAKESEEDK